MTSLFFSTPVDIDIVLDDGDQRATVDVKADKGGGREKAALYLDGESVRGQVTVRPKDGKRLEHTGIKVQLIGAIGRCWPWPRLAGHLLAWQLQAWHLLPRRLLPRLTRPGGQKCSSTAGTTTSF